ncbi:hypothetical protein BATDEDRAFT_22595 [Batrachochytrium dendrobatidis JAM81]|uniref:Uncharacterized protein n=2 Tax=Batrachochytrium dendrobatidis TaxID=109871 RepID=F4NVF1_BATDJ|nr:uncharacterized protein BATDEDRAFT_22595 [Batrachochytrium dendrobatidis JAM81]EGF84496.1 hypothetical protein BATDEDRAFT_22595 [Batrachochytrium dendrobatidis JAM81]|eukprot:XP_006675605.1 hypothetical protein BATDEDRAFT_22595 [Batrachochytrium dendrobatidis JAM81]
MKMVGSTVNIDVKLVKVKLRFTKRIQGFRSRVEPTKAYKQLIQLQIEHWNQVGKLKRQFNRHINKHPFHPKYKTIQCKTHVHQCGRVDAKYTEEITNQNIGYWLDIQFGYMLQNVDTEKTIQFNISDNTLLFNGNNQSMINMDIEIVLDLIDGNNIIECMKHHNSKYIVESIYEYAILANNTGCYQVIDVYETNRVNVSINNPVTVDAIHNTVYTINNMVVDPFTILDKY